MPWFPNILAEGEGIAGFAAGLPKENAGVVVVSPCVLDVGPPRRLDEAPNENPGVLVLNKVELSVAAVLGPNEFVGACVVAFVCEIDPKLPNEGLDASALEATGVAPEMPPNKAFGVDASFSAVVDGCVLAPNWNDVDVSLALSNGFPKGEAGAFVPVVAFELNPPNKLF